MAEIKWIKIVTDIFDDEKMLLIESLPEADSVIVIWFKLLCMAGKQNNGGVFMINNRIAYTDEMLSTIFRRPLNVVRLALKTFEMYGMIEIVNDTITIPNWEKHQNLDKMELAKEQNRERVARYREKQKLLTEKAQCNDYSNVTSITSNDADKNKIRLDKEEDKNKNKEIYRQIVDRLNEKAGTNYRHTSKATQSHINARLAEGYTIDDFYIVIDKKCSEWKGSDFEKYLRPETLFGTKFDSYLNAPISMRKGDCGITVDNNAPDDLDGII